MFSRDRVIRALNHRPLDRAPRDLWLSPGLDTERPDEVAEINARFPSDFLHLQAKSPDGKRTKRSPQASEPHTDAWGCTWRATDRVANNVIDGTFMGGTLTELIGSPLANGLDAAGYEPPTELLDPARFLSVNPLCEASGRFALVSSSVRPLDRLRQLRGPEEAVKELCDESPSLRGLVTKVHDFFRREIELWAKTQVDGVVLGDDLTWVSTARRNETIWRSIFKPLYREYCDVLHRHDKFVFFRSEGPSGEDRGEICSEVLKDLVDIGVDAIHAHWSSGEFEKLALRYRNRVTFWGGLDLTKVAPFSCNEIREAVFRMRKAADYGAGGVISQIFWGRQVSLQNVATFFEQWLIPLAVTV
jgi:uroporphyrinogen decarboxylase